jgi:hypothetical protein
VGEVVNNRRGKRMTAKVEGCFDKYSGDSIRIPVNWEFIGMLVFSGEELPEFIKIDGVKYEKKDGC